jgi:hypothetical protein
VKVQSGVVLALDKETTTLKMGHCNRLLRPYKGFRKKTMARLSGRHDVLFYINATGKHWTGINRETPPDESFDETLTSKVVAPSPQIRL